MKRRLVPAVILIPMLFLVTGCIPFLLFGGAIGAGGMKYYNDTVHLEVDSSVFQAHNAAIRALEKFKITITDQKVDNFSSRIRGKFADEDLLMIDMKYTGVITEITVRVGLLGDRKRSERIAQEIVNNLR